MTRALAIVGVITVLAIASCAIGGFDLVDTLAGPGSGGATSTGSQGGQGNVGGGACQHATWPPAPASSDGGPDNVDLVAAVRSVDLGEASLTDGPLVGYDLDQLCTCRGDGDSCKEPAYATGDHCDGPGGRDNAVAQLFKFASTFNPDFKSQALSDQAAAGGWTMLVRVNGYNGKANDDRVTLMLYPSPGMSEDPCWPANTEPKWDGTDRWPVDSVSVEMGAGGGGTGGCAGVAGYDLDQPKFFDDEAYVTDYHVVANLPSAGLVLTTSESLVSIKLVAGAVSARLEQQNGSWALREGLITGRWKMSDFFASLGTLSSGGELICTDHMIYPLLKTGACQFPDIASTLGGPTTPCDSMSFGMGFSADPALIGIIVEVAYNMLPPCPPGTDPKDDSCDM